MKIIIISFITGVIASLLVFLFALIQKRAGGKALYGAAGIIMAVSYIAAHFSLSGIPPLIRSGFNMPTEHWNIFIAGAALVPLAVERFIFKKPILKYIVRFAFIFTGLFFILQVPYVRTWPFWQSLAVFGIISIAAALFWSGGDAATESGKNTVAFSLMITLPLASTAVLGMSSTIALSALNAQIIASSSGIMIMSFIIGKILTAPRLAMAGAPGFAFIMTLFFLIEGYFFADVPLASLILIPGSLSIPGIVKLFPGAKGADGNKTAVISLLGIVVMNLCGILPAVLKNI